MKSGFPASARRLPVHVAISNLQTVELGSEEAPLESPRSLLVLGVALWSELTDDRRDGRRCLAKVLMALLRRRVEDREICRCSRDQ